MIEVVPSAIICHQLLAASCHEYYLSLLLNSWYTLFPWKPVWRSKIPPRIAFFPWTSALGRFWLLIFYGIRELQLWIGAIWVKGVENQWIIFYFIVPLLLSHGLWYGLYLVFYGLCHKVLLTYFQLCKVLFGKHQKMDLWRAALHCDLWCIWREQSTRCFEGIEWSILELKYFFLHSLLDWSCVFYSFPCSNFLDMLGHCNLRDWCTWVFWLIN